MRIIQRHVVVYYLFMSKHYLVKTLGPPGPPNMLRTFIKHTTMTRAVLKPVADSDVAIKGVIFDMDGTLCLPQTYMFKEMRDALGIDKSVDILDHVHSLPPHEEQVAQEKLQEIEKRAMVKMAPQPGVDELLSFLSDNDIPKAICTRNFPIPVNHLTTTFLPNHRFEPVITRDFKPPKPHPAGILHICKGWGIDPENVVMVGDSMDDMQAGFRARATTVLLGNNVNTATQTAPQTDACVSRLDHIIDLLKEGITRKEKP